MTIVVLAYLLGWIVTLLVMYRHDPDEPITLRGLVLSFFLWWVVALVETHDETKHRVYFERISWE